MKKSVRVYVKKNHKFWNMKKINKHSMKIWKTILILMGLVVLYALIARYVNRMPLISPLVSGPMPVYANENPEPINRINVIYNFVRWNESNGGTKGLAVTCAKKGKINEVGYLPIKGYCFDNATDQEVTIKRWFEKHMNVEGMSVQEALVHYTGGADYAYTFR